MERTANTNRSTKATTTVARTHFRSWLESRHILLVNGEHQMKVYMIH